MIPSVNQPFRFSRPALALILASSLLAAILAVTTFRNLNREQRLLENFLLQEGLTLIRSFEAGARTSMRHYMTGTNPLETLVEETAKEESVVYIRILYENGEPAAESGDLPEAMSVEDVQRIFAAGKPVTRIIEGKSVFEVVRVFEPLPPFLPRRGRMQKYAQKWQEEQEKKGQQLIVVGLGTSEFENARREDRVHALFMGAVLFLLGSAGLYFLFLYQSIRVGTSTLANMRLYTENVIESIPAGLITLNGQGTIVSCNSRAETLLSRRLREMKRLRLEELFSPLPTGLLEEQKLLLDKNVLCHGSIGENIPVKLSTSPLLDHDGKSNGLVVVFRDMREIRKIEQQLELSRRLASLGKMAAGVAHEIRNPLGTLRGFAQYFGNEAGDGTDGKKYAELMVSEVDRLNQTISSLLQFARAREPQRLQVKAAELFGKLESLVAADFVAGNISYRQQYDPALSLFADPDLLLQVLLNLLKNSISVTDGGGEVRLTAYEHDAGVQIEVSDSGHGMTEEELERLFDPFFSTRKDGTGLGLAVSHQIVEQHNGRIEVESKLSQGTTMKVFLPGESSD
ncbi:MAG: PAS domain-containing protein [Proteobacteria bacterium]|nr:PAS domain-containing protein [Pseudomonadota bacterium]